MQRTSAVKTSIATSTAGRAESIPSRTRPVLTTARNITGTNTAPRFNIGTSAATASRTNNTQSTRPSTFAGLLSSKKALVSLSTMASASTSATATISTSTSTSNNVHRFSFGETSDNPFLEQPPRKQFKDSPLASSSVTQQTSREALARSQEPARPAGLVLTRVLSINSPVRIPAATTPIQTVRDSSSTAATHDPAAKERLNRDAGIMGDTLRKSLRTTAMDIARKSIMQHSAASPRKAFLKVSEVAARSHGEPSLHDLLAASGSDNDDYSMPSRPFQAMTTQSFAHPDTPFTFESTPLPPLNLTTAPSEPSIQHGLGVPDQGTSTHVGQSMVQGTSDLVAAHDRNFLESSFRARVSMANRAPPYKVLSVNEREALRSSRGPGFRARPVDPRVFTNAGDSGLPRIVKQPLTIPVSPAFSKRVRTKAAPAPTTTMTTKSYLRKGQVRTAAFQRLENITKPSQKNGASGGHQASGSNDGQRIPEMDKEAHSRPSGVIQKSDSLHTRPNPGAAEPQMPLFALDASDSNKTRAQGSTATLYPSTSITDQQPRNIGSSAIFRPTTTTLPRTTTLGPPLRGEGPSTTAAHATFAPAPGRNPVTHPVPFSFATDKLRRDGHGTAPTATTSASVQGQTTAPTTTVDHKAPSTVLSRKPVTHTVPFKFATDELRRDTHTTTAAPVSALTAEQPPTQRHTTAPTLHSRKQLTHPVPFKFATDDILRRRHVMFQSRGASASALNAKSSAAVRKEMAKPANPGAFKRTQPLKRLTVPMPFHFTTQRRAEVRPPVVRHVLTLESAASASIRTPPRRSRLAGVFPVPTGHPILTSSTRVEKPHFVPTVAISPKLGRHVNVPSLRPTQFVLRKSTKELTQPHEFQFHSDQRAREREEHERQQSVRKREQELLDLQQKADRLHQEREQRMRMRESMERSFRARPITHYQPTVIHKATKPLTRPVSPMIGEKRKRYEMEQQYLEQQREEEEFEQDQQQEQPQQLGYSHGQRNEHYNNDSHAALSPTSGSIPDYEVYRSFEEAKILQAQQQSLQQQLTAQERRQVVLANSARATIHQPPIRLSFPMDPETEALQVDDTPRQARDHGEDVRGYTEPLLHQQAPSSSVASVPAVDRSQPQPLPPVRDSFGGSNNHRLSRELRRISLEAGRRISGERGARSRLSDNFSRRSASSAGSRKSGGETGAVQEYYPFTRSQERSNASSTVLTGTRTTTATASAAPVSTTVPASTLTKTTVTSSAATTSTAPASAPIPQPTVTTSTTPVATTTSSITSAKSAPTPSTNRPVAVSGQEKEERRRRSGSFIPLEPATKPTSPSTLSSSKSSRLSRLFGAPPVSSATKLCGDAKESGTTTTASSSSLARSKGPVVIEHTLTLSDL